MNTLAGTPRRLIAYPACRRYDHPNCNSADLIGVGVDDKAELERRLDAGETLSTGEVAVLFETSRWTVDRIVREGTVIGGVKYTIDWTTLGRNRELNPADVKAILAARRKLRSNNEVADPTE